MSKDTGPAPLSRSSGFLNRKHSLYSYPALSLQTSAIPQNSSIMKKEGSGGSCIMNQGRNREEGLKCWGCVKVVARGPGQGQAGIAGARLRGRVCVYLEE